MKRNHIIFNFLAMVLIVFLIANCSENREESLLERTTNFSISECRQDCSVEDIGIRKKEVKDGNLLVRFGYILNCSWERLYLKDVNYSNDTLYLELHQYPKIDTIKSVTNPDSGTVEYITEETYPISQCFCFFNFDFSIKDFDEVPETIRVKDKFSEGKFWDEKDFSIYDVEDDVEVEE